MKLALVVPTYRKNFDVTPPLNIAVLAAYVRQEISGLQVRIFDGTLPHLNVLAELDAFNPDVVGVTATTTQAKTAYRLLDTLKDSGVLTVIGGVHASVLPEEASRHADCVVVGEGEIALVNILKLYQAGQKVPKIVVGEPFSNLDELPIPAYDLLDMEYYLGHTKPEIGKLSAPMMRLITSRGCNFRCPFCYNSTRTSKVRYRSAEKVLEEVQFLYERYHARSVWFYDDEFVANKKRLRNFIHLLRESGLNQKLSWACMSRVDSIDDSTAKLLKENGCVQLFFGIESGMPKTLAYLKCNTVTLQQVETALRICHKYGLAVDGGFVFGAPKETIRDMQESWSWINRHRKLLYGVSYNVLTPYPGSQLWVELEDKENVNYFNLGERALLKNLTLVDHAIKPSDFAGFLQGKEKIVWFGSQFAAEVPFWRIMLHKTSLLILLRYPRDFVEIVSSSM
ncbi:MAG: radical SAM protein [Candidatus Bathyarchaeia archaeon]|jgi:radical SAM superfamily enzyme YgiQ (UPF0313 family)